MTVLENTQIARELGVLDVADEMLVDLDDIERLPAHQLLILATGSQGESMAVLSRLTAGKHDSLQIQKGDTVVISSYTIPGNEEMTQSVINRLFERGADASSSSCDSKPIEARCGVNRPNRPGRARPQSRSRGTGSESRYPPSAAMASSTTSPGALP